MCASITVIFAYPFPLCSPVIPDTSVKEEEAKSIPPADQDIHNIKRPVISEKEIFEFLDSDEPATLNAAHERTDIEVTDDMKKHDDDIMDDDDF